MNEQRHLSLVLAVVMAGLVGLALFRCTPPARAAVRPMQEPAPTCWYAVRMAEREARQLPHARARWAIMADAAAAYFDVPPGILPALIDREQCGPGPYPQGCPWNPHALSNKGARGLGQVMPGSALWGRGIHNPTKAQLDAMDAALHDPGANLCWSARLFAHALRICAGGARRPDYPREAIACALSGYNAGPGVSHYVADILRHWQD